MGVKNARITPQKKILSLAKKVADKKVEKVPAKTPVDPAPVDPALTADPA
jgi:hypothetical protein